MPQMNPYADSHVVACPLFWYKFGLFCAANPTGAFFLSKCDLCEAPVASAKLRVFGLLAILGILAGGLAKAQIVTQGGIVLPTLKQQLETGLLARTPEEQAFVNRVVALVKSGDLPLDMVQGTFLWARRKWPYPMQYFQRALTLRAREIGVGL